MRALTLWQPWADLVANGHKLVENRPWASPTWILGELVAIHAGKKWDKDRLDFIVDVHRRPIKTRDEHVFGAVIGTMRIVRSVTSVEDVERGGWRGQGKWFMGPYGWLLYDVEAIESPIYCRGFQKLWNLPDDVERQVLEQVDR